MTDKSVYRYNLWLGGNSFKEIADIEGVTVNTVIQDIRQFILYKFNISSYCIATSQSSFGDVMAIKEIQNCLLEYPYSKKDDLCYSLWSDGIYKRNESLFKELTVCMKSESLNIIEDKKYILVREIYKDYRSGRVTPLSISRILNRKPFKSELLEIIDNDSGMFAVFSVPLYSIH